MQRTTLVLAAILLLTCQNVFVLGRTSPLKDAESLPFPVADARLIYVSPTGSDSASGLSPEQAIRTVKKGLSLLRDGHGDWLLLKRGHTYELTETIQRPGGTEDAPIVIASWGNGTIPRLLPGPNADDFAADSLLADHVTVRGVSVPGTPASWDPEALHQHLHAIEAELSDQPPLAPGLAIPEDTSTPQPPSPDTSNPMNRLVAFYGIGGGVDPENRRLGWSIWRYGYRRFLQNRVAQDIFQYGLTRVILHNPFGTLPDEPMQFDQYLHMLDTSHLREHALGFSELVKGLTEEFPEVEFIVYIGKLRNDPDFAALIDQEDGPEAWARRAWASARPVCEATRSIGLDASAPTAAGTPEHHFYEWLRSLGMRCYIEARPEHEWQADWPAIAIYSHWQRQDPGRHAAAPGLPRDQMTGEQVLLVLFGEEAEQREDAQAVLDLGETLCVSYYNLDWAVELLQELD